MQKNTTEDGWRLFLKTCQAIPNEEQLNEFFKLFLTIEEKEGLATRTLLVKDLVEEKKTQREIAKDRNISISKITRGSNALKIIGEDLREFLRKHL